MSDDIGPVTPHEARMRDEAARLEASLATTVKTLGLRIAVRYDPVKWCLRVFTKMLPEACLVTHDIDEEAFVRQPDGSTALVDLIQNVIKESQLRLHDQLAVEMTRTNMRQRKFHLTKEDKRVLHDMFMDAYDKRGAYDPHRLEQNKEKLDAYETLINRLFA